MCLLALPDVLRPGDRVLDLGAGSGILALAALGFGASYVVAVDTEEQAVASSHANAALNGASERMTVLHGSIDVVDTSVPYDVVLANINGATLVALASDMYAATKVGGWLVASGIIDAREEACVAAFEAAGYRIERRMQDGDWRSFVCRRVS
jgi:ribosomal protein L11 methyltransferase